jgi:hypothetical protein
MIRYADFFDEFRLASPTGLSLSESVRSQPHPEENKIIDYLNSGEFIIAVPTIEFDILSDEKKFSGSPSIKTDSVWVWVNFLSYYVEEYHIELPDAFIQDMKANNWKMPLTLKIPVIKDYKLRKVCAEFLDTKERFVSKNQKRR